MSAIGKKILLLLNSSGKEKIRRVAPRPFKEANSIGIIYTYDGTKKEGIISDFVNKIADNKKVDCLCFNPEQKAKLDTENAIFSIDDLNILGKINSTETAEFLDKKFEYLFHLDFELNEITNVLLTKSKAQCRVGLHSDSLHKPYELMIGINKNAGLNNLIEQMLKYVNALK